MKTIKDDEASKILQPSGMDAGVAPETSATDVTDMSAEYANPSASVGADAPTGHAASPVLTETPAAQVPSTQALVQQAESPKVYPPSAAARTTNALLALRNAERTDPDVYVKDAEFAKTSGVPPRVVTVHRDTFRERFKEEQRAANLYNSPWLATWITQEDNAKTAWDDVENLTSLEGAVRAGNNALVAIDATIAVSVETLRFERQVETAQDTQRSFSEIYDDETTRYWTSDGKPVRSEHGFLWPDEFVRIPYRYFKSRFISPQQAREDATRQADVLAAQRKRLADASPSMTTTEFSKSFSYKDGVLPGLSGFGSAVVNNPLGAVVWFVENTARDVLPGVAIAAVTAFTTRNPFAAVSVVGGLGYGAERYQGVGDNFEKAALDLSNKDDVARIIDDPSILRDAAWEAHMRGLAVGAFAAVSQALGGIKLSAKSEWNTFWQIIQQTLSPAAGEFSAQKMSGQEIDPDKIVRQIGVSGTGALISNGPSLSKGQTSQAAGKKAQQSNEIINTLVDGASQSKLRVRDPSRFAGLIQDITVDTRLQHFYIAAEKATNELKRRGIDIGSLLGPVARIDPKYLALVNHAGADVIIPVAAYTTMLAGTALDNALRTSLKIAPEDMSADDIQEAKDAEALARNLERAGRSKSGARQEALFTISERRNRAEREGLSQAEFSKKYPLPDWDAVNPDSSAPSLTVPNGGQVPATPGTKAGTAKAVPLPGETGMPDATVPTAAPGENQAVEKSEIVDPGSTLDDTARAVADLLPDADFPTFIDKSVPYFSAGFDWQNDKTNSRFAAGVDASIIAGSLPSAADGSISGGPENTTRLGGVDEKQFAAGLENYLLEGVAASKKLRGQFEHVASWIADIYPRVWASGGEASGELAPMLQRLVISKSVIDEARTNMSDFDPLAAARAAGASGEEQDALRALHQKSVDATSQGMRAEGMAPIRREKDERYQAEKADVYRQAEEEVNRVPVYRAAEWLTNRRRLGDGAPENMPDLRFNRDLLVERYGEGVLKLLPQGEFTVYAETGGMDPDYVAAWFGFSSGEELLTALALVPPREEVIENRTQQVMLERYGDILIDGRGEQRAIEALHNDERAAFLSEDLKLLKAKTGDTTVEPNIAELRETARQAIDNMPVDEALQGKRFLVAGKRAAATANIVAGHIEAGHNQPDDAMAGGADTSDEQAESRFAELLKQKRRQRLNHALYAESLKVEKEVEATQGFVARFTDPGLRRELGGSAMRAIDEVLGRYGMLPKSQNVAPREGALLRHAGLMGVQGRENELIGGGADLEAIAAKPHMRLTVGELRRVAEQLKNLETNARRQETLKDKRGSRDLGEAATAVAASVGGASALVVASSADEAKASIFDTGGTADSVLLGIDGTTNGPAYTELKAPLDAAKVDLINGRREAAGKIEALYQLYSPAELDEMDRFNHIPALDGRFSHWDIITLALNAGSAENYAALTDQNTPGHFTPQQIDQAIGLLDERDWNFIKSTWAMFGGYSQQVAVREERVTGVAPQAPQARVVETAFGPMPGGYFPLTRETSATSPADDDEVARTAKAIAAGRYGKAQTAKSGPAGQEPAGGRVSLDIGAMHDHVNGLVQDLAMSETVANSLRLLQQPEIKRAFAERGREGDLKVLNDWVTDVAGGDLRSAGFSGGGFGKDVDSTVATFAQGLGDVLLPEETVARSIATVGRENMLLGLQDMLRRPLDGENSAASVVMDKSPLMRQRMAGFSAIPADAKRGGNAIMSQWGDWIAQKAQFHAVDMPTWLGGYRQAKSQGKNEVEAVKHADAMVVASAVQPTAQSREQTTRLFSALSTSVYNKVAAPGRNARLADPQSVLSWTANRVLSSTLETMVADITSGQGLEGAKANSWKDFVAQNSAFGLSATSPSKRRASTRARGGKTPLTAENMTALEPISQPLQQAAERQAAGAGTPLPGNGTDLFLPLHPAQLNHFTAAISAR